MDTTNKDERFLFLSSLVNRSLHEGGLHMYYMHEAVFPATQRLGVGQVM